MVILEQESLVGGNTALSGAGFDIPENWVQKAQGIEDSKELYKEDTLKGGDNKGIVPLVDVLVNRAPSDGRMAQRLCRSGDYG